MSDTMLIDTTLQKGVSGIAPFEINRAGDAFVCLTRPPIESYVTFDSPNNPAFRLSEGRRIRRTFSKVYLFQPYPDSGQMQVGILNGSDDVDTGLPQERRIGTIRVSQACSANHYWRGNFINNSPINITGTLIRLVEVHLSAKTAGQWGLVYRRRSPTGTPLKYQSLHAAGVTASGTSAYDDGRIAPVLTPQLLWEFYDDAVAPSTTERNVLIDNSVQSTMIIPVNMILPPQQSVFFEVVTQGALDLAITYRWIDEG